MAHPPPPPALFNDTTTNSNFSNNLITAAGSDARARGDLATGEMGTLFIKNSNDIMRNGQSGVSMFDTLTFTTPGNAITEVTANFTLEGTLANSVAGSQYNGASASGAVRIYDITGLSTWIVSYQESPPEVPPNPSYFSPLTPLVSTFSVFALGSQEFLDASYQPVADEYFMDTSGTPRDFSLSKSITFSVDPLRTYAIELTQFSSSFGIASNDFLSTGAFSFTNLNGATFTSGSGQFLTQAASEPIPEPATIALLGIGLVGLAGVAARRKWKKKAVDKS